MSNYRNVLSSTRRVHRERSQPLNRAKFGLLEKHKDYTERAKNFHKKERALKSLALKASLRNPDEFYFKMTGGSEVPRESTGLNNKQLKGMKVQDQNYLQMKIQQDERSIARSLGELNSLAAAGNSSAPNNSSHVIFHQGAEPFEAAKYFDTDKELLGRSFNRPRKVQLEEGKFLVAGGPAALGKILKAQEENYEAINKRINRKRKLQEESDKIGTQLALMGKGRRQKFTVEDEATGQRVVRYKWKQERKK